MRIRRVFWCLAALQLMSGCGGGGGPLPEPPDLTFGHLLLYPTGDAERLLGRRVTRTKDGAWSISSPGSGGCAVSRVEVENTSFRTRRRVRVDALAVLDADVASLIKFKLAFGRLSYASLDVSTRSVLRADFAGACADDVVEKVFVGTGKRTLYSSDSAEAGGKTHGVNAGVGGGKADSQDDDWDAPLGFAFQVRAASVSAGGRGLQPIGLNVDLPRVITDGDELALSVSAAVPAYLVVFHTEDSGPGTLLWPRDSNPEPLVSPGRSLALPSAAEVIGGFRLRPWLRTPGRPAREALVVYAFARREDFERLRPGPGDDASNGATYAGGLTARLAELPQGSWDRAILEYEIRPVNAP